MRAPSWLILACGSLVAPSAFGQGPGGERPGRPAGAGPGADVTRLMAFDKDKDGSLTKAELTDERLHRLFDRADADHDGKVTKDELDKLAAAEPPSNFGPGGPGGGPGFGPGGPGGPGGPRGGGMMMGGPFAPGEVLPTPMRRMLRLTEEQTAEVEALQKEVDARLKKILTADQDKQLKQVRERGMGGPGGPGGPGGGFGGPGGPGGGGGRPGGPPPDRDRDDDARPRREPKA